ncbi:hypothetical protein [Streptomyces sp. NPDC020965]|uniref:hypothetical protein n=1 Tax=Streptomyces sp. NPDC020965 TaxID=3365105 RepID=UPI00379E1433
MSAWLRDTDRDPRTAPSGSPTPVPTPHRDTPGAEPPAPGTDPQRVAQVTGPGAQWLASSGTYPHSLLAHWEAEPATATALTCGSVFDVVNVPAIFGRHMLDRLWAEGPGSGPVAMHRGRMLLFAAPGTAGRLPALLEWEEWGASVPPPLCHGTGDAVTIPPLVESGRPGTGSRWLVAPDTRHPWLPGPEVLLWACVRAARAAVSPEVHVSIFPRTDQGAKVYDVSRRR